MSWSHNAARVKGDEDDDDNDNDVEIDDAVDGDDKGLTKDNMSQYDTIINKCSCKTKLGMCNQGVLRVVVIKIQSVWPTG